jgi:predicted alpha/beta hydrolase family esterase
MRNAIIFHGTEGYPEENWFPWLKKELEQRGYNVSVPQFPTPPNVPAKISEWWEVLKNYQIDRDTLLIGHSLGGKFLLRVLEKQSQPVKLAAFIGTPIGISPIANNERDNAFTGNVFDWNKIKENAERFIVFQSDTDPYVGLKNGEILAKNLGVKLNFIPNAGHFNAKAGYTKFPELLNAIIER